MRPRPDPGCRADDDDEANLGYLTVGTCVGWTSPVIPKFQNITENSPLLDVVGQQEEGWISSTLSIGALAGCPFAGIFANKIGRKWNLLLSSIIFSIAYSWFMFVNKVWHIYIGRLLQGFASGIIVTLMPTYNAEIATDKLRGPLGSLITIFMTGGILYVYIFGAFVSFKVLQIWCLAVPIAFLGTFSFMPETPYFYAMKHRKSEAIKVLQFLRNKNGPAVEEEFKQIQSAVDAEMSNSGSFSDILRIPSNRKAFLMCCGLLTFQELSGIDAVTFNSESIFISANSPLKPALAAVILATTQFVGSLISPFVVKRFDRKVIITSSALAMGFALFALGTFFYIQTFGDATAILWIPIPALILFELMFSIGFDPIIWVVFGEIIPTNIRGTVSSFATTWNWFLTFLITCFYPDINALGSYYVFWIFSGLCGLSVVFVQFYLIETKGLSLQEIQEKLK